jgi:hypothetical protein
MPGAVEGAHEVVTGQRARRSDLDLGIHPRHVADEHRGRPVGEVEANPVPHRVELVGLRRGVEDSKFTCHAGMIGSHRSFHIAAEP